MIGYAGMEILSTAWRTDLAVLEASGSKVEDHGGYVVVRTPANPGFWWGNFLLLRKVPLRRDVAGWRAVFTEELPGLEHCAIGIDDPEITLEEMRPFAEAGFEVDLGVALTVTSLPPPRRPAPRGVELRHLTSDEDWAQRLALSLRVFGDDPARSYREFTQKRVDAERALSESGRGAWFGAFDAGRMVSGLGIFDAGGGLARFQSVETHPEFRRRGLASSLVHAAATYALDPDDGLGARTVVIVASADAPARRVYESVGLRPTERQAQAVIAPPGLRP